MGWILGEEGKEGELPFFRSEGARRAVVAVRGGGWGVGGVRDMAGVAA